MLPWCHYVIIVVQQCCTMTRILVIILCVVTLQVVHFCTIWVYISNIKAVPNCTAMYSMFPCCVVLHSTVYQLYNTMHRNLNRFANIVHHNNLKLVVMSIVLLWTILSCHSAVSSSEKQWPTGMTLKPGWWAKLWWATTFFAASYCKSATRWELERKGDLPWKCDPKIKLWCIRWRLYLHTPRGHGTY